MSFRNSIFSFLVLIFACQAPESMDSESKVSVQEPDSTESQMDSSLWELNLAIREDVNNAVLYIERAEYHMDKDDFVSAKADLDRAYFIDTTALKPLLAFSDFWLKSGKLGYTLSVLETADAIHPKNPQVQVKYSELYLFAKNNEKSMKYADLAVKYDPFFAKAYYMKGFNFLELGDTARAISSYQTAVEQNPDYFEAYLELGLLYASMDNDLAIQYYDNALSIQPNEYRVLYSKGLYLQEHEMYNEAIQTYFKATKDFPDFREAHFNLGYVHMFYLKLYREATLYFTDAIEVDPYYHQAYYNRGYSFELMGDVTNAKRDYQKALSIKADYTLAAEGISRVNALMEL